MSTRRTLLVLLAWLGCALAVSAQAPPPNERPKDAPAPRIHIASFGLWGEEMIFVREATGAARVLRSYFGATYFAVAGQVIVRTNTMQRAEARLPDLRRELAAVAQGANLQQDVLVLFLTSHGLKEGIGIVAPSVQSEELVSPKRLGRLLRETGIRHKLVIVSACYSGVFADALANEETLVMTAADADHPSFGCGPDVTDDWTYFGRALFVDGLAPGRLLEDAFKIAAARVRERERAENFDYSNPQMRGGSAVITRLAAIRATATR